MKFFKKETWRFDKYNKTWAGRKSKCWWRGSSKTSRINAPHSLTVESGILIPKINEILLCLRKIFKTFFWKNKALFQVLTETDKRLLDTLICGNHWFLWRIRRSKFTENPPFLVIICCCQNSLRKTGKLNVTIDMSDGKDNWIC